MAEESTEVQGNEVDYVQNYEDQKFSEFNERSDLLNGGYSPDIDDYQSGDNPDGDPAAIMNGEEQQPQQPQQQQQAQEAQPAPFATINHYGQAYNFKDKEELEAMAYRGIELNTIANKLNQYGNIIQAAENDPNLAKAIGDAINAYNNAAKQGQQPVDDADKEPEQRDDEDYDDYEKRLDEWKRQQIIKDVRGQLQREAQQAQEYQAQQNLQAVNQIVTKECFRDPYRKQIVDIINSPKFDAGLRQRALYNGFEFMKAYDFVRTTVLGQPPFYDAPPLAPYAQQPMRTQQQAGQQRPNRNAPYTERASGAPVKAGNNKQGFPDIKRMSPEQFEAYKNSFMLSSLNE